MARLAGWFALLNIVGVLATLATGPLQARALGVDGRGELAAILVPVGLAPILVGLGLRDYVTKAFDGADNKRDFLASMLMIGFALGVVGAALAIPFAYIVSNGRATVLLWLLIDFCLLPLLVMLDVVQGLCAARRSWVLVSSARLLPRLLALAAISWLFIASQLSVATAAATWIFTGVLGAFPSVLSTRGLWGGRPQISQMKEALHFGSRWWLGSIASQGNQRLDQLLMTRLTSEYQLGLYAVAVVLANFPVYIATSSLPSLLLGTVKETSWRTVAIASRATVLFMVMAGIGVSAVAFWVLYYFFGPEFTEATTITCVLTVSMIPLAVVAVLAPCCAAAGHPAASARAEVAAFVVTAVCLPFAITTFGALGAAFVSIVAYTTSGIVMTRFAARIFGVRPSAFWVPRIDDVRALNEAIIGRLRRNDDK